MKTYSREGIIESNKSNKSNKSNTRLNKYLSDAGICSRRQADKLIEDGHITVDGKVAVVGQKVSDQQVILLDGKEVCSHDDFILIAFNKPVGIECTTDSGNPDNIIDYIHFPRRIYPIGRLDKASRGLILLTNTGEIVNGILKSSNYHEKEYIVKVDRVIDDDFLKNLEKGVELEDGTLTRKCKTKYIDSHSFRIILTQGLNRQIRRMCKVYGAEVIDLKRVRIMNITLGNLKEGCYRNVTESEIKELLKGIGYGK